MRVGAAILAILTWLGTAISSAAPAAAAGIIITVWQFLGIASVIENLPGYRAAFTRLQGQGWPLWAFVGGPFAWLAGEFQSLAQAFGLEFAIYVRRARWLVNRGTPENRLDPNQLVASAVQSVQDEAAVLEALLDEGYDAATARRLIAIAGQPIAPVQALDLYNRWRAGMAKPGRAYNEAWVKQSLAESALKNKYQDAVVDLADQLLGASDYVRMSVRDAFDDAVAARDRTDEDFPAPLGPLLRALGYRQEDAVATWRAHWDLPSPTQAYDMLHRGLIDQAELSEYLRQADYAPRWRPLLQAISYNPITRTDAKRAYKLRVGGFDEARLLATYKALGYNDADAAMLVTFTREDVGEEARQERELLVGPVRTQALNLYKARRITEAELRAVLANLKYADAIVDRYVADIEFVRVADARDEVAAAVKSSYVKALRTRDDTRQILLDNGWTGEAADEVLVAWDLLRQATELQPHQAATRDLTKTEVVAAYADGLVDRENAAGQLANLGYDENEATTLLALADYKAGVATTTLAVENVHLNYLRGAYDSPSAAIALNGLGVPAVKLANLLMKWERERANVVPDLTVAQLEGMVKAGVMQEDVAQRFLADQGFSPDQQTYLLAWWLGRRRPPVIPAG